MVSALALALGFFFRLLLLVYKMALGYEDVLGYFTFIIIYVYYLIMGIYSYSWIIILVLEVNRAELQGILRSDIAVLKWPHNKIKMQNTVLFMK